MSIDTSRRANIRGYFGASGTGKSSAVKQYLRDLNPPRLLVWDCEGEYLEHARPATARDLGAVPSRYAAFALAYKAPATANRGACFNVFCHLALSVAEDRGGCVVVCDELAEVTGTGKALDGWGALVRTGRKRGVQLIAASIRPAEIDKTFYSQCTYIRSGRLIFPNDSRRVAGVLGVDPVDLEGLEDCDYIERDLQSGGPATRGTIRPVDRPKSARR